MRKGWDGLDCSEYMREAIEEWFRICLEVMLDVTRRISY